MTDSGMEADSVKGRRTRVKSRAAVLSRWVDRMELALEKPILGISMALVAATIVIAFEQVVERYGFGRSSSLLFEINGWMLVWYSYLPLYLLYRWNNHISIEMILVKLPPKRRERLQITNDLIVAGVAATLAYGGVLNCVLLISVGFTSASSLHAPMGVVTAVIPLSMAMLAFCASNSAVKRIVHSGAAHEPRSG